MTDIGGGIQVGSDMSVSETDRMSIRNASCRFGIRGTCWWQCSIATPTQLCGIGPCCSRWWGSAATADAGTAASPVTWCSSCGSRQEREVSQQRKEQTLELWWLRDQELSHRPQLQQDQQHQENIPLLNMINFPCTHDNSLRVKKKIMVT